MQCSTRKTLTSGGRQAAVRHSTIPLFMPRMFVYPPEDGHASQSTNWAWRGITSLIRLTTLTLRRAITKNSNGRSPSWVEGGEPESMVGRICERGKFWAGSRKSGSCRHENAKEEEEDEVTGRGKSETLSWGRRRETGRWFQRRGCFFCELGDRKIVDSSCTPLTNKPVVWSTLRQLMP